MGKKWRLKFVPKIDNEGTRGLCDSPNQARKKILILESLQGEEMLEVLIHEQLHGALWHLDEEYVAQIAKDMARNLTRLGYKRKEP